MAFSGSSGAAWQPPVAPPVRKRAWGKILVGSLGLVLVALPLLVVGLVVAVGSSTWNASDPEAQGRVPGAMSLDAEDGRKYVVALGGEVDGKAALRQGFDESAVVYIRCTVTHADGSTDTIRGDRQFSSVVSTHYATIGTFRGKGGATAVDCSATTKAYFGGERDLPVIVHDTNGALLWLWIGSLAAGAVVGLLAGGLLAWGIRGRPVPLASLVRRLR